MRIRQPVGFAIMQGLTVELMSSAQMEACLHCRHGVLHCTFIVVIGTDGLICLFGAQRDYFFRALASDCSTGVLLHQFHVELIERQGARHVK